MINRELFEKAKEACGLLCAKGITDEMIEKCKERLGVTFPESYVEFLKEIGEGGITGAYIYGIEDAEYASVIKKTEKFRKELRIPESYVVVENPATLSEEWLLCLDTERMKDGECPVVKYTFGTGEVTDYAENFAEAFNMTVKDVYLRHLGEVE